MIDWLLTKSHYGIVSSIFGAVVGLCSMILLNSVVRGECVFTITLLVSVLVFVLTHFILETFTEQEFVYEKDWVLVYSRKTDFLMCFH